MGLRACDPLLVLALHLRSAQISTEPRKFVPGSTAPMRILSSGIGHTHSPAHIPLPELPGVPTSGARHYGTARLAHRIVPFGGP